jgi:hypothetical protein
MYIAQEVGGTVIEEDRLVVMAGAEWVEWYQTHGFHVAVLLSVSLLQLGERR